MYHTHLNGLTWLMDNNPLCFGLLYETLKSNLLADLLSRPAISPPTSLPWWIVIVIDWMGEGDLWQQAVGKLQALLRWAPQKANGSEFKGGTIVITHNCIRRRQSTFINLQIRYQHKQWEELPDYPKLNGTPALHLPASYQVLGFNWSNLRNQDNMVGIWYGSQCIILQYRPNSVMTTVHPSPSSVFWTSFQFI